MTHIPLPLELVAESVARETAKLKDEMEEQIVKLQGLATAREFESSLAIGQAAGNETQRINVQAAQLSAIDGLVHKGLKLQLSHIMVDADTAALLGWRDEENYRYWKDAGDRLNAAVAVANEQLGKLREVAAKAAQTAQRPGNALRAEGPRALVQ